MDMIIQTSCTLSFEAELSADAQVELSLEVDGESERHLLDIVRL